MALRLTPVARRTCPTASSAWTAFRHQVLQTPRLTALARGRRKPSARSVPVWNPLDFLPSSQKPCGQRKAFGRRLAQCPEGYNICFAVVEMLKGHQRKGKSKKAPSVRPQPTHATPLVTQCRPPINLSRAAFRACLGAVLSTEADRPFASRRSNAAEECGHLRFEPMAFPRERLRG